MEPEKIYDLRGSSAIMKAQLNQIWIDECPEERSGTKLVLIEPRAGRAGVYGNRILMTPFKGREASRPLMMDVGGMHNTEYVQEVIERLRVSQ